MSDLDHESLTERIRRIVNDDAQPDLGYPIESCVVCPYYHPPGECRGGDEDSAEIPTWTVELEGMWSECPRAGTQETGVLVWGAP